MDVTNTSQFSFAPRRPIAFVPGKRRFVRFLPKAWAFRFWGSGAFAEPAQEHRGRCFGW